MTAQKSKKKPKKRSAKPAGPPPKKERGLYILLLSGGMDSAAALRWMIEEDDVITVLFLLPNTPEGERRAAAAVSRAAGPGVREHREVPLPFLHAAKVKGKPEGYIPRRNLVFYAVAAAIAEQEGARGIVAGHLTTDGEDFPDATIPYFRDLQKVLGVSLYFPFLDWTKDQVLAYGMDHGVRFDLTWSCYKDGQRPCGRCVSCRERREAIELERKIRRELER
jgi:7-cyano-7-deazaguanine synthase